MHKRVQKPSWRTTAPLIVVALTGIAASVPTSSGAQPAFAYFAIQTQPHERPFVVGMTDPATIAEARELIRRHQSKIVNGIIVTKPVPYNPAWGFHYTPSTVRLADFTIEVCDATTTYVQEHLSEVGGHFLPGNRWCPWHTRLLREVPGR
jgi:hypothetical protein